MPAGACGCQLVRGARQTVRTAGTDDYEINMLHDWHSLLLDDPELRFSKCVAARLPCRHSGRSRSGCLARKWATNPDARIRCKACLAAAGGARLPSDSLRPPRRQ